MLDETKIQKILSLSQELNTLKPTDEARVLTKEEHEELVEKNQDKIPVSYTHVMVVKSVLNVIHRSNIYPANRTPVFNALMDFIEFLVQDNQDGGKVFEKWISKFIDISIQQLEHDLAELRHRVN